MTKLQMVLFYIYLNFIDIMSFQKTHKTQFLLFEVKEQAKLIYGEMSDVIIKS